MAQGNYSLHNLWDPRDKKDVFQYVYFRRPFVNFSKNVLALNDFWPSRFLMDVGKSTFVDTTLHQHDFVHINYSGI